MQEEIKAMFLRSKSDIENLKKLERIRTEFLGMFLMSLERQSLQFRVSGNFA